MQAPPAAGKAAARAPHPASPHKTKTGVDSPPQTAGKTIHWCCLKPPGLWRCVRDAQNWLRCLHHPPRPPLWPPPPCPAQDQRHHPTRGSGILWPSSLSSPMGTQAQKGCRGHTKYPRNWGAFPELQVQGYGEGRAAGAKSGPSGPKRFSRCGEGAGRGPPPGSPQCVSIWPPGKFSFVRIKSRKLGFR